MPPAELNGAFNVINTWTPEADSVFDQLAHDDDYAPMHLVNYLPANLPWEGEE